MQQTVSAARAKRADDVRFIGALTGCYALLGRQTDDDEGIPVYSCRLCSISPNQVVIIAPVIAHEDEIVIMHFHDFGIMRTRVVRELPTGFVADLLLDDDGREKLASKIRWKRSNTHAHIPDKREFPRFMPRHPRSVMTMGDGSRHPCFVIDVSQSGAAVSAAILPGKGTPLAIGALIGRVVRRLDVGFAVQFVVQHEVKDLERLLVEPPGSLAAQVEAAALSA
jgi:hypothetical protein